MGERTETLMRVLVAVLTGILLGIWKIIVDIFFVINFFWTLIVGKRIEEFATFSEKWNTQMYVFRRYLLFASNERPWPFNPLKKSMSKFK